MRGWVECIAVVGGAESGRDEKLHEALRSTAGVVPFHVDVSRDLGRRVLTWAGPADAARLAAWKLLRAVLEIGDGEPVLSVSFFPLGETSLETCRSRVERLASDAREKMEATVELVEGGPPPLPELAGNGETGPLLRLEAGHRWFELEFRLRETTPEALGSLVEELRAVTGALEEEAGGAWALESRETGQPVVLVRLGETSAETPGEIIERVREGVEAAGGEVEEVSLLGMMPRTAVIEIAEQALSGVASLEERSLEDRIEKSGRSRFRERVASTVPAPGGGAVAARVGVYATSLARKALAISLRKTRDRDLARELEQQLVTLVEISETFERLEEEDQEGFLALLEAWRQSRGSGGAGGVDEQAILGAIEPPLRTLAAALELLEELETIADRAVKGEIAAESDVAIAAELARSLAESSGWNVRVNLPSLEVGSESEQEVRRRHAELAESVERRFGTVRQKLDGIIAS